jgi:hypothetical protein
MSMYFIKMEAATYMQAREHLTQAQRKNKEEENETRMTSRDQKLAAWHEPKSHLGQLLTASHTTTKNIHILVPG